MSNTLTRAGVFSIVVLVAMTLPAPVDGGSTVESLAKPSPQQLVWQDYEIGVMIHWGTETFLDLETDTAADRAVLSRIEAVNLDTDQWVAVAAAMGAKYIMIVAKHHSGFCLWQTDTTDYSIKNTPWRDGKGDVIKDLSESCRKAGIRLGVYLSPADFVFGAIMSGGGVTQDKELQKLYVKVYRQQLTELLTRYGHMMEVWFDGSLKKETMDISDILREHVPQAVVFNSPWATIRWVGNEGGWAPYPAWNAVNSDDPDVLSGNATARNGDPEGDQWLPNECDARIRATWFWNSYGADTLKSVDELMDMYYRSVGHGGVLLLNITPDVTGAIPAADAKRAAEFGTEIERRFGKCLAQTSGAGEVLEMSLGGSRTIDHVVTAEVIAHGERVREYVVEGFTGGGWKTLCQGSAIGHKKIDQFEPVRVSRVRLRCSESVGQPLIRQFAVYDTTK